MFLTSIFYYIFIVVKILVNKDGDKTIRISNEKFCKFMEDIKEEAVFL